MHLSFRFCACAAATIMMMAGPGRAADHETVQAGAVEIVPPAGWSMERDPKGPVVLKRSDDKQLSVIVTASEALDGPLPDAVRAVMHRSFVDQKLELEHLHEGNSIFGYRGVSFEESFRHEQLDRRLQVCGLGLNVNGQLHLAWM